MIENQIICGDCVEEIKKIPDESIDLCIFSPPYDKLRDYHGFSIDMTSLGKEIYRVSKEGSVCCVVVGDSTKNFCKSMTTFRLAVHWNEKIGWNLFETIIYSKFGRPGVWWNRRFRVDHEYILIFFKGKQPKYFDKSHLSVPSKHKDKLWKGTTRRTNGSTVVNKTTKQKSTKCRGTIWHYNVSSTEGNKIKLKHPATYPDQLAEDLIKCFSQNKDIVLDPTVGSGTTARMCKKNDRKYIGIDISKEYVDIANNLLNIDSKKSEAQIDIFEEPII